MIDKKQTEKKGNRPTHSLFIKSDQLTKPFNVKVASMWQDNEKGYISFSLQELELRENPNAKGDEPRYHMFVSTAIYGQPQLIKVADVIENDTKDGFKVSFGDMVAFENKPHKTKQPLKEETASLN